jgi:hypothetical protein
VKERSFLREICACRWVLRAAKVLAEASLCDIITHAVVLDGSMDFIACIFDFFESACVFVNDGFDEIYSQIPYKFSVLGEIAATMTCCADSRGSVPILSIQEIGVTILGSI